MKLREAKKYLKRAEKAGYVAYHSGIVAFEDGGRISSYGVNIDGNGCHGQPFGCPQIIWSAENAEELFPTRRR